MKQEITPKSIATLFVVLAALYLAAFYGWEHWEHRLGPWEAEFVTDDRGAPSVLIYQTNLAVRGLELRLHDVPSPGTNGYRKVTFDEPGSKIPWGRVLYSDLRSHPGIVTLDLFGHEVELMPRTLIVNKREIPWTREKMIELYSSNRPPVSPQSPK